MSGDHVCLVVIVILSFGAGALATMAVDTTRKWNESAKFMSDRRHLHSAVRLWAEVAIFLIVATLSALYVAIGGAAA